MKAELLAIYIKSSDNYVKSSTTNTSEARYIKLFNSESQSKHFIRNNGILEYDYEIVKVTLEVEK